MTATEYDFLLTRSDILEQAYRKIGALGDGQQLSSEKSSDGQKKLNTLLKDWGDLGVHLWTYVTETVPTVIGTASYSIPTTNGLSYVESVSYRENDKDEWLERISMRTYEDTYDKATPGSPLAFSHVQAEAKVYIYPVPNKVVTLRISGVRRLKDWDSNGEAGDLPAKWQRALIWALAFELSSDYGLAMNERQFLGVQADKLFREARATERDTQDRTFVRGSY